MLTVYDSNIPIHYDASTTDFLLFLPCRSKDNIYRARTMAIQLCVKNLGISYRSLKFLVPILCGYSQHNIHNLINNHNFKAGISNLR